MRPNRLGEELLLKENSEWLRYVFWMAAVGMAYLFVLSITSPNKDGMQVYATFTGFLLLGFSGFVIKTRRVTVNPLLQVIIIYTKGFRSTTVNKIPLRDIKRIQLCLIPDTYEDSKGMTKPCDSWSVVLILDESRITVNQNLFSSKDQATKLANKINQWLKNENPQSSFINT